MARKKRKSLREMQREKLKRQRSITRTKPNNLASQRVEKVKVKVEPQKQLRGSGAKRSLPPGNKGGAIKSKVKPQGSVSAKSAIKAAELERAKQGTKGPTRTGQPSGSANRKYGANVVKGATQRALRSAAFRTSAKGGAAGLAMTAAEIAARQGALGGKVKNEFEQGDARMDRFLKNPLKKDTTKEKTFKSKPSRKTSGGNTNRRGRRITSSSSKPSSSKPTKSGSSESAASLARKQGLANNQRAAGMSADLRGSGSKKATAKATSKPSGGSTAKPKPKTGANDPRNASYIRAAKKLNSSKTTTKKDRDALVDKGLSTWEKANPKLAEALEKKKAKKAARRAGGTLYSGTTGMSSIG